MGRIHVCERYVRNCNLRQCYNCGRFGHIKVQCRVSARCSRCSRTGHNKNECELEDIKCLNCRSTEHHAWSDVCPRRKEEKERCSRLRELRTIDYSLQPPSKLNSQRTAPSEILSISSASLSDSRSQQPHQRPQNEPPRFFAHGPIHPERGCSSLQPGLTLEGTESGSSTISSTTSDPRRSTRARKAPAKLAGQ